MRIRLAGPIDPWFMILTSKEEKGQLDHVPSFRNAVMVPSSPIHVQQPCKSISSSPISGLDISTSSCNHKNSKKIWQQNLQSWRKPKGEIAFGWIVGWVGLLCFPVGWNLKPWYMSSWYGAYKNWMNLVIQRRSNSRSKAPLSSCSQLAHPHLLSRNQAVWINVQNDRHLPKG